MAICDRPVMSRGEGESKYGKPFLQKSTICFFMQNRSLTINEMSLKTTSTFLQQRLSIDTSRKAHVVSAMGCVMTDLYFRLSLDLELCLS